MSETAIGIPSAAQGAARAWWEALYDEDVADLLLVRSGPTEVRLTVDFLQEVLRLGPDSLVFDQCCGIGSLAIPLAQRGAQVIGVDLIDSYITRARAESEPAGVAARCTFHRGDAFRFTPQEPCDAALNWGTGFGNAETDAENLQMLQRAWESLRPGGLFILDYQNIARVLAGFQPALVRRSRSAAGEIVLLRESELDLPNGCLRQRWTVLRPDGSRRVTRTAVRLYLPHEISALLQRAGFTEVTFFGGVSHEPLGLQSPRCIALARKGESHDRV